MVLQIFPDIVTPFVQLAPRIAGAIIVLIIGWAAGRLIGRGLSKVLDKAGVDDAVRKTAIGRAIERAGITVVKFFDLIIRWFVYLIAIFAAVDILQIAVLSSFMNTVVQYLPSFIAGVLILIIGFVVVDFIGDSVRAVAEEGKVEYAGLLAVGVRFLLYFVVIIVGLSLMRIDVSILYVFANALAWGAAVGVGVGLGIAFGWGLKDAVAKRADSWISGMTETARRVEAAQAAKAQTSKTEEPT